MRVSNAGIVQWLYRLDSYTNAEFGRPRTLCAIQEVCVACGELRGKLLTSGLCPQCAARREPDDSEVVLFRPLRKPRQDT